MNIFDNVYLFNLLNVYLELLMVWKLLGLFCKKVKLS